MVPSAMWEVFSEFHMLQLIIRAIRQEIIAKYEKRGKYMPILHKATCDNYFSVKCFLIPNMARVLTNCIELA